MAITSATIPTGGRRPVGIRKGEAWDADDPIVVAHPELFTTDARTARRSTPRGEVVEQSTRAPGEKSRARRVQA
jgi:hypothetical protein